MASHAHNGFGLAVFLFVASVLSDSVDGVASRSFRMVSPSAVTQTPLSLCVHTHVRHQPLDAELMTGADHSNVRRLQARRSYKNEVMLGKEQKAAYQLIPTQRLGNNLFRVIHMADMPTRPTKGEVRRPNSRWPNAKLLHVCDSDPVMACLAPHTVLRAIWMFAVLLIATPARPRHDPWRIGY